MAITIYRTHTETLIKQNLLQQLMHRLPTSLHSRALRYQSIQSSYNYVVGRLLLKQGLEHFGLNSDLEKIEIQENGKPTIPGIHFNISHSDDQVLCAFSKEGSIGIDLEKIKPVDFENFTSMFSVNEWKIINSSDNPIRAFYRFWTRKESIIKALGRKLSYLHQIELDVTLDHFVTDGKRWFLQELSIEEDFFATICYEEKNAEVEVIEIYF